MDEQKFQRVVGLLRHPLVDVTESEELLRQFIRQCQFDSYELGWMDRNSVGDRDEMTNPYTEEESP